MVTKSVDNIFAYFDSLLLHVPFVSIFFLISVLQNVIVMECIRRFCNK